MNNLHVNSVNMGAQQPDTMIFRRGINDSIIVIFIIISIIVTIIIIIILMDGTGGGGGGFIGVGRS